MKLLGVRNIGSTCYFASVLQSVIYIKDIRKYIKTTQKSNECLDILKEIIGVTSKRSPICGKRGREDFNIVVLDPTDILHQFKNKFPYWEIREQQDAHECFVQFIDFLQCFTKDRQYSLSFESSRNGYSKYIEYMNANPSIISQLYCGLTTNHIKCLECNNLISKYDITNSINLEVPRENCSLSSLLQKYIKKEKNSDSDNLYHCEGCDKKVVSTIKSGFYKLPKLLVVCLKRYDYNKYPPRKINTTVDYPLEGLRIREQLSDKVKDYTLESIILHFGSFFGGHYTCVSRINNRWFNFDDESVMEIDRNNVKKMRQAYILVYRCLN